MPYRFVTSLLNHISEISRQISIKRRKTVQHGIHTTAFTNICGKNYFRIKTIDELAIELNIDPKAYLSRI